MRLKLWLTYRLWRYGADEMQIASTGEQATIWVVR